MSAEPKLSVTIEYVRKLNWSLLRARIPLVWRFEIRNRDSTPVAGLRVRIEVPGYLAAHTSIPAIKVGATHSIEPDKWIWTKEDFEAAMAVANPIRVPLRIEIGARKLEASLALLTADEWCAGVRWVETARFAGFVLDSTVELNRATIDLPSGALHVHATQREWTGSPPLQAAVAALVQPGHPRIIDEIKPRVISMLRGIADARNIVLDDLLAGTPAQRKAVVQAVFATLAELHPQGFLDIEKEETFEAGSQRIRFIDDAVEHGMTCAEWAIHPCAILEVLGLEVLFILIGTRPRMCHALVAIRLTGTKPWGALLTEAKDIQNRNVLVIDFSKLARGENFSDACNAAKHLVKTSSFLYGVYLPAARELGIRPLPPPRGSDGNGDRDNPLRRAYLQRVLEQCSRVALDTIDPAAPSPSGDAGLRLTSVYTALLTKGGRRSEADRAESTRLSAEAERERSALEQLDRHRRLVLLGGAGGGKSTFVNFVAACLAGEALGDPDMNVARLTAPLPDEQGEDRYADQPWAHGALIPVPVILREFAATGLPAPRVRATASDLWTFIEGKLREARLGDFAPSLEQELREQGGLVFLDGLDEVPDAEMRREQVVGAVQDFADSFGRCRVLVTARPYAYDQLDADGQPIWRLDRFETAELADFTDGQIRRFIRAWHMQLAKRGVKDSSTAAGFGELLEQALFGRERLLELARRPLLLTLMASLHARQGGSLPESREELYDLTVTLLLHRWEAHRVVHSPSGAPAQPLGFTTLLDAGPEQVRRALQELAFEVHGTQPGLAGTADVHEDKLIATLVRIKRDLRPGLVVDYLDDRAGLLLARGNRVYAFPHRSIQEYLAACHLTGSDFPDNIAGLARADPDRWREVALLAAAKAGRGAVNAVWDMVDALCPHEPPTRP